MELKFEVSVGPMTIRYLSRELGQVSDDMLPESNSPCSCPEHPIEEEQQRLPLVLV